MVRKDNDKNIIDILYAHYKDSFEKILSKEKLRDRLFFLVIFLLGLIVIEYRYSIEILSAISELNVVGLKIKLNQLPLPVILSTTWTIFFGILLRYYQITLDIDKKYSYLHNLESRISKKIGVSSKLFDRESASYLTHKGKFFRYWAWIFYTAAFPIIILAVIIILIWLEINSSEIQLEHRIYDLVLAVFCIGTVIFYLIGIWFNR